MKSSNINIRVDKEIKEKCEKIYESLGINMSIAINLFLNQTIRANGIPFEIKAPNIEETKIDGNNDTIKIGNKKIRCIRKNNLYYFKYNNEKFVVSYEIVDANEVCIYPGGWKIENKGVFPSVVHFETSNITDYKSKSYDEMVSITDKINKIIILKKVDVISIHPNHEKKQLLLPENKVNGINIVLESEVDHLLQYYNDFNDIVEYVL
ncbi:MAG: type II toxin-antitoxin system RelB/DinJ family antitoxin [Bacilli bacterium]|nr:type II toxin-antitoxin system RelB/DinJ family antitoxin [Bacilli bacterium]